MIKQIGLVLVLGIASALAQAPRPPVDKLSQMRDVNVSGLASGQLLKWNGTSFVPIGTTAGENILSLTNPSAITFLRVNADNTASLISQSAMVTALGLNAPGEVTVKTAQGTVSNYKATANTDLSRGVALTNAFAAHSDGDEMTVGSGTYEIAAPLTLKLANLRGTGVAIIKLTNQGSSAFSAAISVISANETASQSVRHITNILFDCNVQNQSASNANVGAVGARNAVIIEGCGAVNWGAKTNAFENFVFQTAASVGDGGIQGGKILNCYINAAAPTTLAGVTTLFDAYSDLAGATVSSDWTSGFEFAGNVAHDITCGGGSGQPLSVHTFTLGQSYGGSIHDNFVWNMNGGSTDPYKDNTVIYQDSFSARSLSIYNNVFLNCASTIKAAVADATRTLDNWHIVGNHFQTNSTGIGVCLDQSGSATFSGWVVSNNYFKGPNGINLNTGSNYTLTNNTIDASITAIGLGSATAVSQHGNYTSAGVVVGTPTPFTLAEGGTGAATAITATSALGLHSFTDESSDTYATAWGLYGIDVDGNPEMEAHYNAADAAGWVFVHPIPSSAIAGTTTNDSASAGNLGQYTSSYIVTGSAVSLTTATAANVTTLSLTAGDWDVEGNVNFNGGGATTTATSAGISTTTATLPTDGSECASGVITSTATYVNTITLPRKRISLSGTTTIYLVAKSTFSAGTTTAFGGITARRVR